MKKIISIVLTIFMLTSLVPTLSFADDATASVPAATPDKKGHIMLFDLCNPQTLATAGYQDYVATPSAFAYEGKSSSLKWEMDMTSDAENGKYVSNAPNLYLPYTATDLSAYSSSEEATVNVRFYSENIGSKFNIVYYGATTSPYYRKGLTEIEGGWQVYQVALKDVMAKLTNYQTEKTLRIAFNDDGWNNLAKGGYNDGDTIYIDQIWIDTDPNGYYSDKTVIWNSETSTLSTGDNWTWNEKIAIEPVLNTYQELEMRLGTDNKGATIKLLGQSTNNILDKGKYTWLNAWIYSEKPQDNGFHFQFNSSNQNGGTRVSVKQIDWSGWKLISVAIPNSMNIKYIGLLGYTYRNNKNTPHNTGDTSGITIGLDNIWVSNEDNSPQATYEANLKSSFYTSSPYETTSDDLMNVNFNNSDNIYNPHIYTKNERLSFNSITYADLVAYSDGTEISPAKIATLTVYDSKTDSSSDIIPTSTSYVNAWIYNPSPKYTWDGINYADIALILKYRDGSSNKRAFIPANWSGWKLISIPVSALDLANESIYGIDIECNNPDIWFPVVNGNISSTDNKNVEYRTTGRCNVFGGMSTSYNSGSYYNFYNYIDIERVWISEGAPKGAGTVVEADNTALKCPETAGSDINLFTASNVGKIDVNVIAKNDTTCTKVNASVLSDGTLVLPSNLDFGTDYYVYAEIYAPNGEKTPVELSFSSEDYHISDKTVNGKTATITMHGNLSAQYASSILVAAVYTDDTGKELECASVGEIADNGIVTVTIPENVSIEGKKVSFFFVDSIGSIKPLKFNIQK